MMDVTNENFVKQLPEITETIKNCDFIAIDTELSGLTREKSLNRFDSPEERFAKLVESSRGYFIMQFGLSCFSRVRDLSYNTKTFNFYIFPQQHKLYGDINRTFSLQAHAIQFLTEQGFDFNKLFKHGVSYLTFQEKKALKDQLRSDIKSRSTVEFDVHGVPNFVPASMNTFCREWIKKINKFSERRAEYRREGELSVNPIEDKGDNRDTKTIQDSTSPVQDRLEMRDCNTNHRRSLMRRVIECLPSSQNLEVIDAMDSEAGQNYLIVEYVDKSVKHERFRNALLVAKGFLEVIELVIVHKKPLIGHNLALDLIQIINQFMEPLSENYASFKDTCQSLFPLVYDTKYIAHMILDPKTLTQNQSRLYDLYCQLKDSSSFPKLEVVHRGTFFDENQMPHQAGYDAYMSGYCFIVLCEAYLMGGEVKRNKQSRMGESTLPPPISSHRQIVDEFSNKIHLSFSHDFRCYDLGGEEVQPDRKHIFYVEFPSSWTLDDIFHIFHQNGGVEVSRLDKTTALCALRDKRQTTEVMKKIQNHKGANYKIFTYETYLECYKTIRKRHTEFDDG